MIFKIKNRDNDKYLICCNFSKLLDILKQFNIYHLFILNFNDGNSFNLEELDEQDENYNDLISRFNNNENFFNNFESTFS